MTYIRSLDCRDTLICSSTCKSPNPVIAGRGTAGEAGGSEDDDEEEDGMGCWRGGRIVRGE